MGALGKDSSIARGQAHVSYKYAWEQLGAMKAFGEPILRRRRKGWRNKANGISHRIAEELLWAKEVR